MDEKVIFTYLAEKVIEDIRKNTLKPDIALALRIYPFNNYIRPMLVKDDIGHIKVLFKNPSDEIKAFALMISRPFQGDDGIRKTILGFWEDANKSFLVAFDSIYRLLEYEDITSQHKKEFFDYIKSHWTQWKQKLPPCYPEPSRIIAGATERIENPDFPEWKKWIYLVEVACSPDNDKAKSFLDNFDTTNNDFRGEVKKWALLVL